MLRYSGVSCLWVLSSSGATWCHLGPQPGQV